MNSYWGGAIPAIGGALVVGAFPRILRYWQARHVALLGLGGAILMNSRPLEGFILCLPVAACFLIQLSRGHRPPRKIILHHFVFPLSVIASASAIFFCYYNWRGTGNPFLMPYNINERNYVSTPTLLWQSERPPLQFSNPQFDAFYNSWMRNLWLEGQSDTLPHAAKHIFSVITKFTYFFLWPELCVMLAALPWIMRDRRVRFLIIQSAVCFFAFLLVAWFQPHYAAPLTATVFALLVQGLRHLRRWKYSGKPVGIGLTRVVVLFALLLAPFHPHAATIGNVAISGIEYRARFQAQLEATAGKQLVVVRYSPEHDVLAEWVYNKADIDNAKVIWVRELPGTDITPVLNYFSGRRVWLVEPDTSPPSLAPYFK